MLRSAASRPPAFSAVRARLTARCSEASVTWTPGHSDIEQLVLGHDTSGMAYEIADEAQHQRLDGEGLATEPEAPGGVVELEVAEGERHVSAPR